MPNENVKALIAALIQEHGEIEVSLDRFADAAASGRIDVALFRQVAAVNAEHYLREERFLRILQTHDPSLASKLRAQHDEALEIAARLDESLASGETGDLLYLARRYLAIAQHNIIEEERDVFPLADHFTSAEEPDR